MKYCIIDTKLNFTFTVDSAKAAAFYTIFENQLLTVNPLKKIFVRIHKWFISKNSRCWNTQDAGAVKYDVMHFEQSYVMDKASRVAYFIDTYGAKLQVLWYNPISWIKILPVYFECKKIAFERDWKSTPLYKQFGIYFRLKNQKVW